MRQKSRPDAASIPRQPASRIAPASRFLPYPSSDQPLPSPPDRETSLIPDCLYHQISLPSPPSARLPQPSPASMLVISSPPAGLAPSCMRPSAVCSSADAVPAITCASMRPYPQALHRRKWLVLNGLAFSAQVGQPGHLVCGCKVLHAPHRRQMGKSAQELCQCCVI